MESRIVRVKAAFKKEHSFSTNIGEENCNVLNLEHIFYGVAI